MIFLSRSFVLAPKKSVEKINIFAKSMPFTRYLLEIQQSHRGQLNSWRSKHDMAHKSGVYVLYLSNTTLFDGIYIYISGIYYIRYNYMFWRLTMAIFRLYMK